jgi:hypothetical protein
MTETVSSSAREKWIRENFQRFIQDDAPDHEQGMTKINSIQNGLLLRSDVHDLFDAYEFGVNPDVSVPVARCCSAPLLPEDIRRVINK